MKAILNIDTTTTVCSVALATESGVTASRIDRSGNNHSKVIGVFTRDILEEAKQNGVEICAVALSQGPGSYTGLRIGASFAKGFCYGNNIPLIAIPTLKIMAGTVAKTVENKDALLCPMIDARRMEVYSAVFDTNLNEVEPVKANIIDADSFSGLMKDKEIYFFGNGSAKCAKVLTSACAKFIEGIDPLATEMGTMAWQAYNNGEFVDVAYFEPFYLKEFIATIPKNKVLGNI